MRNLRAMDLSTSWNKYPQAIKGRCVGTGCLHAERRRDGHRERVAALIARRQWAVLLILPCLGFSREETLVRWCIQSGFLCFLSWREYANDKQWCSVYDPKGIQVEKATQAAQVAARWHNVARPDDVWELFPSLHCAFCVVCWPQTNSAFVVGTLVF